MLGKFLLNPLWKSVNCTLCPILPLLSYFLHSSQVILLKTSLIMSLPCLKYFPISFPIKFKLLPMVYNVWVPSFLNFMITSLSSLFLQMHFPLKTPLILPAWKALSSFLPPDSCTFFKKASLTAWTWPVFPQSPLLTHPLSLMSHIQPDQNC